jgi:hypothetical protein
MFELEVGILKHTSPLIKIGMYLMNVIGCKDKKKGRYLLCLCV